MRGFQVPRRIASDEEGYVYFFQTNSGYLYGPYANRGAAQGVLTVESRYGTPRPTIWDARTRTYVPNPAYDPNNKGKVVKRKLGPIEDAPRISQKEKLKNATARIAELEAMVARLMSSRD